MKLDESGELGLQWPLRHPGHPITVLAHRGSVGSARENTVAAFLAALESGADGVELDVRATATGTPVVLHDAELPGLGPLSGLEDGALPPWLPTLAEALAACAGAVVDVELKGPPPGAALEPVEALAAEVAAMLWAQQQSGTGPSAIVVSSFWPGLLEVVGQARPGLELGLLVNPAFDALDALEQAQRLGAGVLLPFRDAVSAELVEAAHRRRTAVWAWTVNEDADVRAVAAAGVDALVTDRVPGALAALGRD